jgi:hypothetical protein
MNTEQEVDDTDQDCSRAFAPSVFIREHSVSIIFQIFDASAAPRCFDLVRRANAQRQNASGTSLNG